jgi:glycosyltransferase involved in cell wall biosynthesis
MNTTTEHDPGQEAWFFTSELQGQRAGSFRQERWCRLFLEAGVRVTVFNVRGATRLTVAEFATLEEFGAFRASMAARGESKASVREGALARGLRRIKHLFLVDLYLPNIAMLVLAARRRIPRARPGLVVMCSSPPFSTAVAGSVLKSICPGRFRLAVDMRDAWAMHAALGGIKALKRAVEGRVLRRADFVSTVSIGLKEEFERVHGVPTRTIYNVATHYFGVAETGKPDWRALSPRIDPARLKLVYTGSTPEGFYDVRTLVSAARRIRAEEPGLAGAFQLVFVGACAEVRLEAERQGFSGDDIVFVPHVTHAVAQSIQQHADVLVFLGSGGVGIVSTKIFEYLALGRPILPLFVARGSDVDRILLRFCAKSMQLLTVEEIMGAIRTASKQGWTQSLPRLGDPSAVRCLLDDYRQSVRELLGPR